MDNKDRTAVEQVIETIRAGIEKGTFKTGDKLPSQRQLAVLFGVSRMVIREAVKVLEGKGVLSSKRGSGIYVKRSDFPLSGALPNGSGEYVLSEIVQLCRVVWEFSTGAVVDNATDEEFRALLERTENLYDRYPQATAHQKFIYESSFGMSICKLSGNALVYDLMVELLKATSTIDYDIIANAPNYKDVIGIDKKIIEALMERDGHRAKFWAQERDREIDKMIRKKQDVLDKKYRIYISHADEAL